MSRLLEAAKRTEVGELGDVWSPVALPLVPLTPAAWWPPVPRLL